MAQIDIKQAEVRFYDGTLGTCTLESAPADSDLVVTAISKHIGRKTIKITLVDPAVADQALSVTVDGRDITVNLATSAVPAISSTAAEVKAAMDALAACAALVTVTLETSGAGIVEAQAETVLAGQQYVEIKVGEGTLTYSEKKPRVFTKDRGNLDTVKNDESEPMDVSIDSTWEWIKSTTGGTITFEDAVKKRSLAAAWATTSDDPSQPYCVDIEIYNAPDCSSVLNEVVMLEEFYYENIDHDLRDGTLAASGRCNREEAEILRATA